MGSMVPISLLAAMMEIRMVFVGNGRFQHRPWIDQADLVHGHIGDFKPLLFQPFAGVQDGVVLDGGGDDVVALLAVSKGRAA